MKSLISPTAKGRLLHKKIGAEKREKKLVKFATKEVRIRR